MARYSDAAKFRDMLAALDRQAKQAAALSAEAAAAGAGGDAKTVQFQLGQRVVHRALGYRCACLTAWQCLFLLLMLVLVLLPPEAFVTCWSCSIGQTLVAIHNKLLRRLGMYQ